MNFPNMGAGDERFSYFAHHLDWESRVHTSAERTARHKNTGVKKQKNRQSWFLPAKPFAVRRRLVQLLAMKGENFCLTISNMLYKLRLMRNALNLDAAFSALADPTRRAILARLASGEATVNELAEPFDMSQPAISQHLKVLDQAGLIVQRVDGAKRPRRLSKEGIGALDQWLAMLRKALERNYEALDQVLFTLDSNLKEKKR